MATGGVRAIPCGPFANESERLALEKLKAKLNGISGPWILLSNLNHSPHPHLRSDEIDIVILGPSGVYVVEVKHWDAGFLKQRPLDVEHEAERIQLKAKRIAGKLKQRLDPGFVSARFLLTRHTGSFPNQRPMFRGIPVFGLAECRELVTADKTGILSATDIELAAKLLEPTIKVSLSGEVRTFAGLINLERVTSPDDAFHREFRGQHPTRRDKVLLHLYDLSATDDHKLGVERAKREFEVMQRWQKSPFVPSLLDSFQEAENYPGELFYFSLIDPASPSVKERTKDAAWSVDERLCFTRASLKALASFHEPLEPGQPALVHRHLTPLTLRVRHNGEPLFTDFGFSRLAEAQTISAVKVDFGDDAPYVAPEVRAAGLAAANAHSDVYSICAVLKEIFVGDSPAEEQAQAALALGLSYNPEGRACISELLASFDALMQKPAELLRTELPLPRFWDEDTVVPFQNSRYKVVSRLGGGGIGQTFKVVELDAYSDEKFGTYVAKVIDHVEDGEPALKAYRKARAYTIHPNLSAIHEIAPEWQSDRFVALMRWVEGMPLKDLTGVVSLYAEELGEEQPEPLVLHWLNSLCEALSQFHRVGLVHGDVSPRNIIVQGGQVVLTDYDTVTEVDGKPRSSGTPQYTSPAIEKGWNIQPMDDLFALAASLFHVLFDREPFVYGNERHKDRGINWNGVDRSGLERVCTFLDRATSANRGERLHDAGQALAVLDAKIEIDEPSCVVSREEVTPTSESLPVSPERQYNSRLTELLSAYPGSRHGNNETRGLDTPFAASTYVETRLDAALIEEMASGKIDLALLFGNAGDGKTAFLQHLLQTITGQTVPSAQRVSTGELEDGRKLLVNLDGSASWQGKSANALLDEVFQPFLDGITGGRLHLLAINSGKLLEWLEQQNPDNDFVDRLYRALLDDEEALDGRLRLIDLNRRSLVGGVDQAAQCIGIDFLDNLLNRFLGTDDASDPWAACPQCTAQTRCTAWRSVRLLRGHAEGPHIRRQLADALQACHMRGETHITARELRAALVYIFFGVHSCDELHAAPDLQPVPFAVRAFDPQSPQRQGELLAELTRFDPALESDPHLDRHFLQTTMHSPGKGAQALADARRCAYFEGIPCMPDGRSLRPPGLTGAPQLERFRHVPLMSEAERTVLTHELCDGIARLEDLPAHAFLQSPGLPLRITPRTPTESAFWVVKPRQRFSLAAPLPRTTEGLEALHTHLELTYTGLEGRTEHLRIGLELFHLLLALKDGAQLSGAGQEGVFSHLEIFTQRLAQEDARELYGWHPAEEDQVFRLCVRARDGRQVLVREVLREAEQSTSEVSA